MDNPLLELAAQLEATVRNGEASTPADLRAAAAAATDVAAMLSSMAADADRERRASRARVETGEG